MLPSTAFAQYAQEQPHAGSVEVMGGVAWLGGYDAGSSLANQTRNPGTGDGPLTLFQVDGRVGPAVALQGNLDPATLFLPLPQQQKRVARVLELAGRAGRGHVFNLGHGVLVGTPVENVKALVEQVHAHTPPR